MASGDHPNCPEARLSCPTPPLSMNALCSALQSQTLPAALKPRGFCVPSLDHVSADQPFRSSRTGSLLARSARVRTRASDALLKEEWLQSLSFPFPETVRQVAPVSAVEIGSDSDWAVGVDPDVSGAVALLKSDSSGYSAQAFDTPNLQVLVGRRVVNV